MQVLVSEVVLPGGWCSFCFTWLVIPRIVGVTGTEVAIAWVFWSWLDCPIFKITYTFTLYLWSAIFPCYDEF